MSASGVLAAMLVAAAVVLGGDAALGAVDARHIRHRLRPGGRECYASRLAAARARLDAWRPSTRRRRAEQALDALAPMLDDVARQTRAARSIPAALEAALAGHPELARWIAGPTRAREHVEAPPESELPVEAALANRALAVAATSPSSAADTCERAARAIRDRRAVAAERAAQSAPARLSARVMTVLPLGVAAWAAAVDDDVRHVLTATPLGWACLAGGVGLNLAGRWWTNRLIAGGQR